MESADTSLKGQLLLDGGKLQGSFFHRSVVLICQHDAEGAFGLVLNQSPDSAVENLVRAELPESLEDSPLYLGGPVQPGALSYLHSDDYLPTATVIPDVALGHSLDDLTEIGESFSPSKKVRIFSGYAGWSPGQLEAEMDNDAWLTHPASIKHIFEVDPSLLWQTILKEKSWQHRLLAESPDDMSWN